MEHVAHQCICMQYILELVSEQLNGSVAIEFSIKIRYLFINIYLFQSKQLDVDPRACIGSFFERIQVAEPEYKRHFDSEVESFKERIKKRALEKIEEALAEQEVSTICRLPSLMAHRRLTFDVTLSV